MPGAGADPIWSEPESAPGPRTSRAGAAQKSGGSATLQKSVQFCLLPLNIIVKSNNLILPIIFRYRYVIKIVHLFFIKQTFNFFRILNRKLVFMYQFKFFMIFLVFKFSRIRQINPNPQHWSSVIATCTLLIPCGGEDGMCVVPG